jgi:threonine/homoserine/homoserine lactone efflux protein
MATEIALSLSPGPAILFVVSRGLRFGGRRSVWANLGILSANAFYFLLSAVGLGAALLASHDLFLVIRYAGAAYLIYLGIATIFGKGMALEAGSGGPAEDRGGVRLLARGFVLQAANPKALLFFTALLPQFLRPDFPVAPQIAMLGGSSVCAEFFVLLGYGFFSGRLSVLAREPRFVATTNRVSGALLAGAGAGLALAGER